MRGPQKGKRAKDLVPVVAISRRPKDRSQWLGLGGWRTGHPLPAEALLDALRWNA